jgi:hypothetical protein
LEKTKNSQLEKANSQLAKDKKAVEELLKAEKSKNSQLAKDKKAVEELLIAEQKTYNDFYVSVYY